MDTPCPYDVPDEDWQTIRDRFPDKAGEELISAALRELARRFYGDELHELAGQVTFYTPEELAEMVAKADAAKVATAEIAAAS